MARRAPSTASRSPSPKGGGELINRSLSSPSGGSTGEAGEGGSSLAREVTLTAPAGRLDRALADALPELSRARVQALMASGAITRGGEAMTDPSAKALAGIYRLTLPPAVAPEPRAEAIPLAVLYEDAHLIVIDKAPGMSAHPAPGAARAPWSTP